MPNTDEAQKKDHLKSPYPLPRSFRLDDTTRILLEKLSAKCGISQADVVRLAIRKFSEYEGVG